MIGIFAGFGSAATWAMANYIFSRNLVSCPPMLFNFLTGVVAIFIFLMLLPFLEQVFPPTPFSYWIMLQLSGVVGIGLGDSLFFSAIRSIGPRRTLLMETLASPFTGLISFLYFGDSISLYSWFGMFIVVLGIIIVVNEQQKRSSDASLSSLQQHMIDLEEFSPKKSETQQQYSSNHLHNQQEINVQQYPNTDEIIEPLHINRQSFHSHHSNHHYETNLSVQKTLEQAKLHSTQFKGYMYAVGAMFCQALGMVLARDALAYGSFSPVSSSLIRQVAGQFSVLILLIVANEKIFIPKQNQKQNFYLLTGIILGQVICLWLQQLALQFCRAEVAQTMLSTSPLFALAIAKYSGEVISKRALVGSLIAFGGVCLVVNN